MSSSHDSAETCCASRAQCAAQAGCPQGTPLLQVDIAISCNLLDCLRFVAPVGDASLFVRLLLAIRLCCWHGRGGWNVLGVPVSSAGDRMVKTSAEPDSSEAL
eukprot:TRINITY_DN37014_c0_g1_i5.p3 TRINITY_DN37014_c0_g1~~TRINITY_DN37014_c0_g1_i5.p3  ORF type:complete len:103 (+),score=3.41 TRINITY_DN37014_c0_g1_i5:77-385(+)